MKKHKIGTIKLLFLFATLGAFPFLYPAIQFQQRTMNLDRQAVLPKYPASQVLVPIDPPLGPEVKPDPIE